MDFQPDVDFRILHTFRYKGINTNTKNKFNKIDNVNIKHTNTNRGVKAKIPFNIDKQGKTTNSLNAATNSKTEQLYNELKQQLFKAVIIFIGNKYKDHKILDWNS